MFQRIILVALLCLIPSIAPAQPAKNKKKATSIVPTVADEPYGNDSELMDQLSPPKPPPAPAKPK